MCSVLQLKIPRLVGLSLLVLVTQSHTTTGLSLLVLVTQSHTTTLVSTRASYTEPYTVTRILPVSYRWTKSTEVCGYAVAFALVKQQEWCESRTGSQRQSPRIE